MLAEELKGIVEGDVLTDEATLQKFSRDASLFEVRPEVVVCPKHLKDIQALVRFVTQKKTEGVQISLTPRSAGTDMSGGPLNDSIILDFTKYFNHIKEIGSDYAITEPGVYYRDFEKATLEKGLLLPSFPASKELCAMGGIVANNSGGEKSLVYGKTQNFVEEIKMVLSDGNEYTFSAIDKKVLEVKKKTSGFEGMLYRQLYEIFNEHYEPFHNAKPKVSKNSSGYDVWDVWDKKTFDLTKLITGSQGTLGIITEVKLRLVPVKKHSGMLVVFMGDLKPLANIVHAVLPHNPSSFESFDDHTLRLALRFLPGFLKLLGAKNLFALGMQFIPEFFLILTHGMPKLILLIEFEEDSEEAVRSKLHDLHEELKKFNVVVRVAKTAEEAKKYWAIRRESFNLLRHHVQGKQTAPFVDDVIVAPEKLPQFLPQLYAILDKYKFLYTIAGHVGNGNLHIIPLMKLKKEKEKILPAMNEIYDLVLKMGGSLSAEHNDGLVRSPYLEAMFGYTVSSLFKDIKMIFDPLNIFNPRKKVGADINYAIAHIKES